MGIDSDVFSQTLKYKGYFSYSDLYSYCYDWLKDEGFNISEGEYVEKVTGGGKDIEVKWSATKKVSDYIKHEISVGFSISGMTDEEVMIDGKKKKMNSANLKIKVGAKITKDYESKWDSTPTLKMLRGIYDKYIIKATIGQYEGKLSGKAESFIENVKSYLNLER